MDKQTVETLRSIPIDKVYDEFFDLRYVPTNKRIRNAIDVLVYQGGFPYEKAIEMLNEHFIVSGKFNPDDVPESVDIPKALRKNVKNIDRQLSALKADRFSIYVNNPDNRKLNYSSDREFEFGMTREDIVKKMPFFSMNNCNNGNIFIRPRYDDKVLILVDDVKFDLVELYAPSLLLKTSWQKFQALYVVSKVYAEGFYNSVAVDLNKEYGDPAIKSVNHNVRMVGFTNRKSCHCREGKYPFVSIESENADMSRFESYLDTQYGSYVPKETEEICDIMPEDLSDDLMKQLLYQRGLIEKQFGEAVDRSAVDWRMCKYMRSNYYTMGQTVSYMLAYAMHREPNDRAMMRYVYRTVNRAFA